MKTNNTIDKIKKYILHPEKAIVEICHYDHYQYARWIPDKIYLQALYRLHIGKRLNLNDPQNFNEKLQWLKLHNRKAWYSMLVDKYAVKQYVTEKVGDICIPTIGCWDSFEDIPISDLPKQFVMKCTHDSGSIQICKDKDSFDWNKARKELTTALSKNHYWRGREWPYKNVKPRIIAEPFIENQEGSDELTDYKFYCFHGCADCVMTCYDRKSGEPQFYFLDKDWNLKLYNKRGIEAPEGFKLPRPDKIDEMFRIAEVLAEGLPFARVDLYYAKGAIYFGEITFYPASGCDPNYLEETNMYFGSLLDINKKE